MESHHQGHTTWDTRGRRTTVFHHKQGGGAADPSLPSRKDEPAFTYEDIYYRPSLTRKKAICDFRVRWPELILLDQEKKEEGLPLFGQSSSEKQVHQVSASSSVVSISNTDLESIPSELQDSKGAFAVGPQHYPAEPPYVTILNNYLRPELMTRLERRVKRKTIAALRELEEEMEAVKSRRSVLIMDIKEMQTEMSLEETESKPFLEYLKQRKGESQRKYDSLWKDYSRQCQKIEEWRRELVSDFTSRTADLQEQLLGSSKLEVCFRKKLKTLRPVAQIKESQDRKIEALEQEKASIVSDIRFMDREAHFQFLKEKADLEKQVEELNLLDSGKDITRELKKKTKALEARVQQAHRAFCKAVTAENRQLRTELQQLDQEFCKLEARREKLEQRKQQWKEQQWYLKALARGRQHLWQMEHRPPKPQATPHPTQGRLRGARPRATPK
ncbi:coiled-coil domain-containing protein 121-like [Peromyscus californicus insignis]|uniref:coiled-coil domain-containing protein 121-like n=1 Tax=Peromyscus californicus insignis TaxID=564181 RepID=UPI0022A7724A|nr:coiled-coil domain-containing protein 121-like [Peromyscus californicus insignis]